MNWRIWFCIFAALFFARLEYKAEYFPPYYYGEEAQILDTAESISAARQAHVPLKLLVREASVSYNKGYSWFAYPFYRLLGYDIRIVTLIVPLAVSLVCAAFLVMYQSAYPRANAVLGAIIVTSLAIFVVSVRRYKWHTLSYDACFSVYLFWLPLCKQNISVECKRMVRWGAVGIFGGSCFFYFGNVIYIVPALLLFAIFEWDWVVGHRSALTGTVLLITVGAALSFALGDLWRDRLYVSLREIGRMADSRVLSTRLSTARELYSYFTWPYRILIGLGVATCVVRWRRQPFCLITLILLVWTLSLQLLIEGVNNPDWLNWSMIPIFATLLIGVEQILIWARSREYILVPAAACGIALAAYFEFDRFEWLSGHAHHQAYAEPFNTTAQASLVLRMIHQDASSNNVYFLPGANIPEADGGFRYDVNLKRVDYIEALKRVRFFSDYKELRTLTAALDGRKNAIIYLSASATTEDSPSPLPGTYSVTEYPFAQIYGIKYPVRKVVFY